MAEPHQETREARLALTQLGANYVKTGLQLLGMPTLSKMFIIRLVKEHVNLYAMIEHRGNQPIYFA